MKQLFFLLLSILPWPAHAALAVGDVAPDFELPASLAGKTFRFVLHSALAQGPVVVYFYPSAYTKGCNVQAHLFSERHERFAAAGATVIGVSLDSIDRLNDFSADPEYCAGRVAVASDADGRTARAYGLQVRDAVPGRADTRGIEIGHGFAERTTFVVGADGRIRAVIGGLAAGQNVDKTLEAVQALSAQSR